MGSDHMVIVGENQKEERMPKFILLCNILVPKYSRLTELDLSGGRLSCLPMKHLAPSLRRLNMSNNQLTPNCQKCWLTTETWST